MEVDLLQKVDNICDSLRQLDNPLDVAADQFWRTAQTLLVMRDLLRLCFDQVAWTTYAL